MEDKNTTEGKKIKLQEFETFKDNVKHMVKRKGQLGFIRHILTSGSIPELWEDGEQLYALYLLAMTDYLSKLNGIPLYAGYDGLRRYEMVERIYPLSVHLYAEISGQTMEELTRDAIPEFLKYNIVEGCCPAD